MGSTYGCRRSLSIITGTPKLPILFLLSQCTSLYGRNSIDKGNNGKTGCSCIVRNMFLHGRSRFLSCILNQLFKVSLPPSVRHGRDSTQKPIRKPGFPYEITMNHLRNDNFKRQKVEFASQPPKAKNSIEATATLQRFFPLNLSAKRQNVLTCVGTRRSNEDIIGSFVWKRRKFFG
jgi:hypothetical protein